MFRNNRYNLFWCAAVSLSLFTLDLYFARGSILSAIFMIPLSLLLLLLRALPNGPFSFLGAVLLVVPVFLTIDSFKEVRKFWFVAFIWAESLVVVSTAALLFGGGSSSGNIGAIGIFLMPVFYVVFFVPYACVGLTFVWLRRKVVPKETVLQVIIFICCILIVHSSIKKIQEDSFRKKHITADIRAYAGNVWGVEADYVWSKERSKEVKLSQHMRDQRIDVKRFFKEHTNEQWKKICLESNDRTDDMLKRSDAAVCNAAGALYFEDVSYCYNLPVVQISKREPDLQTKCITAMAIKTEKRSLCESKKINNDYCRQRFDKEFFSENNP